MRIDAWDVEYVVWVRLAGGWHTWHRAIKVKVVGCCPTRKNNSAVPKIRKPTVKQLKQKEKQVFFAPSGEYEETAESGGNMLPAFMASLRWRRVPLWSPGSRFLLIIQITAGGLTSAWIQQAFTPITCVVD